MHPIVSYGFCSATIVSMHGHLKRGHGTVSVTDGSKLVGRSVDRAAQAGTWGVTINLRCEAIMDTIMFAWLFKHSRLEANY